MQSEKKIAEHPEASKNREQTAVFLICYLYASSKKSDWENISENFGGFKKHMHSQKGEISDKARALFMQTKKSR